MSNGSPQKWVCVDMDGTLDAAPAQFRDILRGLKAQGYTIAVLTGCGAKQEVPIDQSGLDFKITKLANLGLADCWDHIVLFGGDPKQLALAKAAWAAEHNACIAWDNDRRNAKAFVKAGVPLVLVPWATREG